VRFFRLLAASVALALALSLTLAGLVVAHTQISSGSYNVALGWADEPTYVGELNAVEAIVTDQDGNAVTDLQPGDLTVTVTAGGQTSDPLALEPAFDPEEGTGLLGDYRAAMIPTIPGDYTFHLTGSIHGQSVDATATSGPDTFDAPAEPAAIEFPNQVPSVSELATRIESVDSRSSSDSQTALYVGAGLGAAGVVIGLVALAFALRAHRQPAA
jgi:hypothetical protein